MSADGNRVLSFVSVKRELSDRNLSTTARFSFLLSIPMILGASMVYPIVKIDFSEFLTYNWAEIIVGTLVSGVVGYLCIKYFLKFLAKFSLNIFGVYCIVIGTVTSLYFYFSM